MDKYNVVYPYDGIVLSNEKNGVLTHGTTWMNLEHIMLK